MEGTLGSEYEKKLAFADEVVQDTTPITTVVMVQQQECWARLNFLFGEGWLLLYISYKRRPDFLCSATLQSGFLIVPVFVVGGPVREADVFSSGLLSCFLFGSLRWAENAGKHVLRFRPHNRCSPRSSCRHTLGPHNWY